MAKRLKRINNVEYSDGVVPEVVALGNDAEDVVLVNDAIYNVLLRHNITETRLKQWLEGWDSTETPDTSEPDLPDPTRAWIQYISEQYENDSRAALPYTVDEYVAAIVNSNLSLQDIANKGFLNLLLVTGTGFAEPAQANQYPDPEYDSDRDYNSEARPSEESENESSEEQHDMYYSNVNADAGGTSNNEDFSLALLSNFADNSSYVDAQSTTFQLNNSNYLVGGSSPQVVEVEEMSQFLRG